MKKRRFLIFNFMFDIQYLLFKDRIGVYIIYLFSLY